MKDIQPHDAIDLIQLIETVWDGKWKIIAITTACVLGVFGLRVLGPTQSFLATTEIKPILASDAEGYRQSNALGFFAVYRDIEARNEARLSTRDRDSGRDRNRDRDKDEIPSAVLDQLFIEQLGNHTLLANILKKNELILREKFESDTDYERALMQLAAKITILPPVSRDSGSRRHWTLQFEFTDQGKWLAALTEIKETLNKNVRNAVKSRFENLQASAKQMRAFDIEDLNARISVLEVTHDGQTKRRLVHLAEHVAIARKLGIAREATPPQPSIYQSLNTQNALNQINKASVTDTTPLYLRGYEALEKEIDLIRSRQDVRPFIEGLLSLEQNKLIRSKDQTPERAERLFAETPVMKPDDFRAVLFDVATTKFQYQSKRTRMLVLAAVMGAMIGVVYVLIASALRGRRKADAK